MMKWSLVMGNKLTAPDSWLPCINSTMSHFGVVNCLLAQKSKRPQEPTSDSDLLGQKRANHSNLPPPFPNIPYVSLLCHVPQMNFPHKKHPSRHPSVVSISQSLTCLTSNTSCRGGQTGDDNIGTGNHKNITSLSPEDGYSKPDITIEEFQAVDQKLGHW